MMEYGQNIKFWDRSSATRFSFLIFLVILFSIFYFLFSLVPAQAAEFDFASQDANIHQGQDFRVGLYIDTQGQNINALEGTILFPDALAGFADIENGNSIVNLWIESPRIVSPGRLTFAGITPGGYIGDNGLIFSLVLRAKNAGEGQMKLSNFRALISDGWGTPAAAKSNDFTLKIIEIIALFPSPSVIGPSEDNAPPEYFEPLLYQDSYMFDGQWFIVFNAEDKGMGMDHYEILETKVPGTHNQKWLNAASPYVLKDQALESYIYVKAVDKKGNERIETLAPKNPALWFEKYLVWVILLVVAAVIYFVNKFLWKTQKK